MTPVEQPRRVLIVLPNQVHLMDMAGAAQVFGTANELTNGGYETFFVGDEPTTVSYQGLGLAVSTAWPELTAGDLVVVAGWKTQSNPRGLSSETLDGVAKHWEQGGHVASICAGSLALADAGILRGQTATTHHDLIGKLSKHPDIDVAEDVLFTCAPRLHTSAGIASGVDLSLHLVAHDHGPALAAKIARILVVPAWRPGNTSQHSMMLAHRDHMDHLAHLAQDILDDVGSPAPTLTALAGELGVSGRTLARHFVLATGLTPQAYGRAVRVERAEQLRQQGWASEAAARAVGYADSRSLRSRTRSGGRSDTK